MTPGPDWPLDGMQVLSHEIRGEAHEIIVAKEIVLRDETEIFLEKMTTVDALQHQLAHASYGLSVLSPQHSSLVYSAAGLLHHHGGDMSRQHRCVLQSQHGPLR